MPTVHPVVSLALAVLTHVQQARRRWGDGSSPAVLRGLDALGFAHLADVERVLLHGRVVLTPVARAASYAPGGLENLCAVVYLPRRLSPPKNSLLTALRTRSSVRDIPTFDRRATVTRDEVAVARRLAWEINLLRHHRYLLTASG